MLILFFNSLVWIVDVALSFIVSSTILCSLVCTGVITYQYARAKIKNSSTFSNVTWPQKVLAVSTLVVTVIVVIFWRAVQLARDIRNEDVDLYFFQLNIASISIRVNRMMLFVYLLLFVPLAICAFYMLANLDHSVFRTVLWLIRHYRRWRNVPSSELLERCIYLEWAEGQYLKSVMSSSRAYMDKRQEVEKLEGEIVCLHGEIRKIENYLEAEKDHVVEAEKKLEDETKKSKELLRKALKRQQRHSLSVLRDDEVCVVCMERKREYLLKPCNHYCICITCKPTLLNQCPLCRKVIKKYEKILFT